MTESHLPKSAQMNGRTGVLRAGEKALILEVLEKSGGTNRMRHEVWGFLLQPYGKINNLF